MDVLDNQEEQTGQLAKKASLKYNSAAQPKPIVQAPVSSEHFISQEVREKNPTIDASKQHSSHAIPAPAPFSAAEIVAPPIQVNNQSGNLA